MSGNPRSPYLGLPTELLRPIIEHIDDQPTLCALCLTHTSLLVEARPILYRDVTSIPDTSAPHVRFLTTVSINDDLARLVRTYTSDSIMRHRGSPLWMLLKSGLKAMSGLKCLTFRAFGGAPAADLLEGCTFQLDSLDWRSHSDEKRLAAWLTTQPRLRRLAIRCDLAIPFPDNACPILEELEGSKTALELLLPGRRVVKVSWVPELEDDNTRAMNHLSSEMSRLHTLSYGGYFSRPRLEFIANLLLSLERLELFDLYGILELDSLTKIPKLSELVISLRWTNTHMLLPLEEQDGCVKKLFSSCSNLRMVDIASIWDEALQEWQYMRWTKGCSVATTLNIQQVRNGRF